MLTRGITPRDQDAPICGYVYPKVSRDLSLPSCGHVSAKLRQYYITSVVLRAGRKSLLSRVFGCLCLWSVSNVISRTPIAPCFNCSRRSDVVQCSTVPWFTCINAPLISRGVKTSRDDSLSLVHSRSWPVCRATSAHLLRTWPL